MAPGAGPAEFRVLSGADTAAESHRGEAVVPGPNWWTSCQERCSTGSRGREAGSSPDLLSLNSSPFPVAGKHESVDRKCTCCGRFNERPADCPSAQHLR